MTQLTLFSDLTTHLANEVPAIVPATAVPVTSRPRPVPPTTAAEAAPTNGFRKNDSRKIEQDTLLTLAELIRDGRAAAEAQSRLRSRPIQSIGDLAQSVLLRHDLVARRRAAAAKQAAGSISGDDSAPAAVQPAARLSGVGSAHLPAQVHVAS